MNVAGDPAALRKIAGWAFVCGLCLAAVVAIVALLSGSFDDTDLRVIASSLGFSVFSSTGAAGGALRRREPISAWAVGMTALISSAIAFALLLTAVWSEEQDGLWRAFGIAGLIALWSGHAALVVSASKPGDSASVKVLGGVAIGALGIDTAVGVLAVLGTLDDADAQGVGQALAALLVLAVLATVLPPILRRLSRLDRPVAAPAVVAFGAPPRRSRNGLADGVAEVAERLGAMELPPQARAEVARLRELVREADAWPISLRCRT